MADLTYLRGKIKKFPCNFSRLNSHFFVGKTAPPRKNVSTTFDCVFQTRTGRRTCLWRHGSLWKCGLRPSSTSPHPTAAPAQTSAPSPSLWKPAISRLGAAPPTSAGWRCVRPVAARVWRELPSLAISDAVGGTGVNPEGDGAGCILPKVLRCRNEMFIPPNVLWRML